MDEKEEPELYLVDPSSWPGAAEWRAERQRKAEEARSRHLALVVSDLEVRFPADVAADLATQVFELLFTHRYQDGRECACSCHPRLPAGDQHDFGFACPCTLTPEERRAGFDRWRADMDAYWESPEGLAETARHAAEEAELDAWIADHPGVEVTSHGGMAPEQWYGTVDGHRFYFRERHDHWRIETDLRPNGHFATVLTGTDDNGESITEQRELEEGDVIAEGMISDDRYGRTSVERAAFIVAAIRDHLRRTTCPVHTTNRGDLERRLGEEARFCPACGMALDEAAT